MCCVEGLTAPKQKRRSEAKESVAISFSAFLWFLVPEGCRQEKRTNLADELLAPAVGVVGGSIDEVDVETGVLLSLESSVEDSLVLGDTQGQSVGADAQSRDCS
jgi:hypothetical protein